MWVGWAGCEGARDNSTTSRSKKSRTHFVPERQERSCVLSPGQQMPPIPASKPPAPGLGCLRCKRGTGQAVAHPRGSGPTGRVSACSTFKMKLKCPPPRKKKKSLKEKFNKN